MFRGKMEMVATFTFKGKASGGNVVCIFFLLNTKKRYKNLKNRRKITKKKEKTQQLGKGWSNSYLTNQFELLDLLKLLVN